MASESRSAAVRPLLFAAVWFVILAGIAFAWAAIENESNASAVKSPPNAVAHLTR